MSLTHTDFIKISGNEDELKETIFDMESKLFGLTLDDVRQYVSIANKG